MEKSRLRPAAATTRRPLPESDPTIDALAPADRRLAAEVWAARIPSEALGVAAFAEHAQALAALHAPDELVALARRASDDERRHAEICRIVASAYRGVEVPTTAPSGAAPAPAGGVPDDLRGLLRVIAQCCVHETIGSVFLERCVAAATAPLAHAALRELLTDEIDHARIGWAALARTPLDVRRALAPWLRPMLAADFRVWRRNPDHRPPSTLLAHGCPPNSVAVDAALCAVREIIIPGFIDGGIDVTEVRAWLDEV